MGHKGCSYTEFLDSLPPSSPASPQGSSVSHSVLEQVTDQFASLPAYSQAANTITSIFKSPRLNVQQTPSIRSIRPQRIFNNDNQSRLSASNVASMKLSLEPLKMSLSTDYVFNMLQQDKAWKIKDVAKLIMAVNGFIEVKEPSEKTGGKSDNTEPARNADDKSEDEEEEV